MDELVARLSQGKHKVSIGERGESYQEIKERINKGFFHVKFTETRGGTELGISVDLEKTNVNTISLESGLLHIEGTTNLNYEDVRLIADIQMADKSGYGYLAVEPSKAEG
jgi:hypothetical protein